jgi:hypothetical protein
MTATPPGSKSPNDDDDNDPSVRLMDALNEDAARDAAAAPGPPSAAAHALSRFARGRFLGRDVGADDGVVQALGSVDGEQLDTARILAMDRAQLVATLSHLRGPHDEPSGGVDEDATDDQLRGAVRALRPGGRP